ncbi:dTDP-4-dehydrorhamnose reductase [Chitinophaga oryziterrae]|uniref:dTDP-4-dehydrorhamnose reductase n=1 Tax=Chitinophaga oryziterrae TaxID=1031224 RepID=A0A6N8J7H7_9BACT|nr:dTDP-4-dehydrorhamnose reductase [Chitinophaga oryziterrae]MVT40518.1 dTDP-4-dehydrorhamnose reductase [Chitinophaga oryziterrae]
MKNILITGANGQLGQAIKKVAAGFPAFNFVYTDYTELDITDTEAIDTIFATQEIHGCINCAAYTAVDKAESDEEMAFKLNFEAALNLADACANYNAQLIHISTDYVFDGKSNRPYTEEDEANPDSIYGSSKLRGEAAAIGTNPATIVIRTSWLYSEFGMNFVKRMRELMQEKESLNVVFDQVGTPTYAVDLAQVILTVLSKVYDVPASYGGVYHYSNEGVISWYDFAVAIKELTNAACTVLPVTSDKYPTAAKRPAYSVFNKQKIKDTFGLQIPYWRNSLQVCLKNL